MVSGGLLKVLGLIPEEGVSLHQLTCKTGLDHRTVKKHLETILAIQNWKRVYKDNVGLRVVVKLEH